MTLLQQTPLTSLPVPAPETIALGTDGRALHLAWTNDDGVAIPARALRLACRCAHCLRARYDGNFIVDVGDITIAVASRLGNLGLNIGFSDGHARGIYPWPYLREIAGRDGSSERPMAGE